MTAELFNHYEIGTWTPQLKGGGGAIGQSGETGHYTRIGNFVYCIFGINVNNLNSQTGALEIHDLPFVSVNVTQGSGEPSFGGLTFANNLSSTDLGGGVILRINNGTDHIECKYTPGGSQSAIGGATWNASNISASTYMTGSFSYTTS